MEGVNEVTLVGNIGSIPERVKVRWPLLKFNLAVTEPRPVGDGKWKDNTQWFRIIIKGKRVDYFQKKLKKGDRVYIKGRLSVRNYEDRNGDKRWITEIEVTAKLLHLASGRNHQEEENRTERQHHEERPAESSTDSEQSGLRENGSFEEGPPDSYDVDLPF